jgi:phage gp46-like protein
MAILDLTIFESGDGGDLDLLNDDLNTIEGLTNQVYLALFGGNRQSTDDSLSELDKRGDWWGNEYLEKENQFNSIFEQKLKQVALSSSGLQELENAAKEDLKFLEEFADIEVNGSITGVGKLELIVDLIEPNNLSTKIKFLWDGTRGTLIERRSI